MAETNGSGNHEERISKLEAARQEMEDTLVVMAHLDSKSAERIKQHAEYIVFLENADKRHALKMAEFDDKLNALIDMIGRQQGGIESRF